MSEIEFIDRYLLLGPRLKRYANLLARNYQDSQDLYQQTTLCVLQARAQYDPGKSSLATWAARIMNNEHIRLLRPTGRNKIRTKSSFIDDNPEVLQLTDYSCRTESNLDVVYWYNQVQLQASPAWLEVSLLLHSGFTFTEIALVHARPEPELVIWYNNERCKLRRKMGITAPKSSKIIRLGYLLPPG